MTKEAKDNGTIEKTNAGSWNTEQKIYDAINNGVLLELAEDRGLDVAKLLEKSNGVEDILNGLAEALKPSKSSNVVRWIQQENLPELADEQAEVVFGLADELGLRQPVDAELPRPKDPVLIIESGANRTSKVRRELAEKMLGQEGGVMYQFGSPDRLIGPTRLDKVGNEVSNPEYEVISADDICGNLDGKTVSEFDVNVASAINSGYEIEMDIIEGYVVLVKDNKTLFIVKSTSFKDGVARLADSGLLDGRNLVIATNGQYRPKDVIQAEKVLAQKNVRIASVQAIGDETGKRGAKIYINELATLLRELARN